MKNLCKYVIGGLSIVFILITAMLVILTICYGTIIYEVNIVDTLMLIITTALTIAVVYLGNSLKKKDTACNIITKDLMHLCKIYSQNMSILEQLEKKKISLNKANTNIRMTFHRGDVVSDMILKEINESFPNFLHNDEEIQYLVQDYWEWLTGGDMQKSGFTISHSFLMEHETRLRSAISNIRLLNLRLIDFA